MDEDRAAERRAAAEALLGAYASHRPIGPVRSSHPRFDVDDAYAVQDLQVERWRAGGRVVVGHKIGLTSAAMREQLGIDQPDVGVMLADVGFASGATLDLDRFISPRVEPEIALVMAGPVPAGASAGAALSAVAAVAPALEVIDSRIAGWDIALVDTVADNASYGAHVIGPSVPVHGLDLAAVGCVLEVDGDAVEHGRSDTVLGSPLNALLWLAGVMASRHRTITAGDLVLTGSITRAVPLVRGSAVTARFEGLPPVGARSS